MTETSTHIVHVIPPGHKLDVHVDLMIRRANAEKARVIADMNGLTVLVDPGSTRSDVINDWLRRNAARRDAIDPIKSARISAIDECIEKVKELLKLQREIVALTRREAHGAFDKNLMFEKGAADALEKAIDHITALKGEG
jgi:hypothetical protein